MITRPSTCDSEMVEVPTSDSLSASELRREPRSESKYKVMEK